MNIVYWLRIGSFVSCLIIAGVSYFINPKNRLNRALSILMLICSAWAFVEFRLDIANEISNALFWKNNFDFIWPFSIAALFHFIYYFIYYPKKPKNKKFIWLAYFISGVIAFLDTFIVINYDLIRKNGSWLITENISHPQLFFFIQFFIPFIGIIYLARLLIYLLHEQDKNKKKQGFLIIFAFSIPILSGLLTEVILARIFPPEKIPQLSIAMLVFTGLIILYTISKHDLLEISPEKAMKNIISIMPDMFFLTDIHGQIINYNDITSKILKYDAKEIEENNIRKLFRKKEQNLIDNILSGTDAKNKNSFIYSKNNKKIDISISSSKVRNNKGKIIGVVFVARDIRKTKRLHDKITNQNEKLTDTVLELELAKNRLDKRQKELTKKNKEVEYLNKNLDKKVKKRTKDLVDANKKIMNLLDMKSKFVNQVAHDLRTPLTPIKALLPLLDKDIRNNNKKQALEKTKRLIDNAKYLGQLVKDTLNISRIDSGNIQIKKDFYSIYDITNEIIENNRILLENENVDIINKIGEKVPKVKADKLQIQELLNNLITNSVKFMKNKTKKQIVLKAIKKKKFLQVSVSDNGIGIEKENLKKIFEEFYKVDTSRHEAAASSGLGLSICKRIIEMHSGKIWAESKGLGKGCSFKFTLPISKKEYSK